MDIEKVRADKTREGNDSFDGSWVPHPDPVQVCREVLDDILGSKPNPWTVPREDLIRDNGALIDVATGTITEQGIRNNIEMHHCMEDLLIRK